MWLDVCLNCWQTLDAAQVGFRGQGFEMCLVSGQKARQRVLDRFEDMVIKLHKILYNSIVQI